MAYAIWWWDVSTAVAERLDSLVTSDPPPCEAYITKTKAQSGRPSSFIIKRECDCGLKSTRHLCASCYFDLMMGTMATAVCALSQLLTGYSA